MYEIIVLGGGPAGLSAALMLADSKCKTLVIEDGRSQMGRAYVTNYLGMDDFEGRMLLDIGRKQLERREVPVLSECVTEIDYKEDHILIATESAQYATEALLLCCGLGPGMKVAELAKVNLASNDEPFAKMKIVIDNQGLTSQPNVYAAGIGAGTSSQAIIAAGHGAQVALNIISAREGKRTHFHRSL